MNSTSEIGAAIIEAGVSGDLDQLKAIRKKVADELEFRKICDAYSDFSTGRNVLHHAAEFRHFEICKFLIKTVRVYINAMTYKRNTPLAEAVKREHVKIVEFLIKHDAVISLPNIEGFTALHFAVLKDNMELMELLQIKGAFIDADSVDGTPLQIAVSRGNAEAVKSLLSHGAKPSFYYAVADSPLLCAVKSRSFECLNLLLAANANPNMYCTGLSPLASAAKEGDTKFLKSLLKARANPNSFQTDIFKPIEVAAMVHNRAAMEILFPVTEQLPHYPNWTVDGIIEYIHSDDFRAMSEEKMTSCLNELDLRAVQDVSNKNYNHAIILYRMATTLDPSNAATWISKRSLCEAHEGICVHATVDAQKWIRLKPDLPVPIPHQGGEIAAAAHEIFTKFLMAGLAFVLDPYNKKTCHLFRVSLFHYFDWLSQRSRPDEILRFSR
ncbi:ankyrin-1-like isoform X2 [Salvia divinorum]|uniref:Ankyrin-1-like isoform X2 n=1 Tax=Salvia divinorum TaxID=28513 RepID=A0ABD1IK51_SALDI